MSIEVLLDKLNMETDIIRLEPDYKFFRPDVKDGKIYSLENLSCRIVYDIKDKRENYICGKLFIESIDYKRYINVWINLLRYDKGVMNDIVTLIENNIDTKDINICTEPFEHDVHSLLEELNYKHQKDYIYPDVKLYFKEVI